MPVSRGGGGIAAGSSPLSVGPNRRGSKKRICLTHTQEILHDGFESYFNGLHLSLVPGIALEQWVHQQLILLRIRWSKVADHSRTCLGLAHAVHVQLEIDLGALMEESLHRGDCVQ